MARPHDPALLGYLLMDEEIEYWWDGQVWVALSRMIDGRETITDMPPADAFRPDWMTARVEATLLTARGIPARAVRVAVLCRS